MDISVKNKNYKLPRIYCKTCDFYETPYCVECGTELKMGKGIIKECECGAPLKIKCADGHDTCEIVNWYIPRFIPYGMKFKEAGI